MTTCECHASISSRWCAVHTVCTQCCSQKWHCRVDIGKIGLVHPQLPLPVCTTLGIPALEAVVAEELSPECRPRRIASIQVRIKKHGSPYGACVLTAGPQACTERCRGSRCSRMVRCFTQLLLHRARPWRKLRACCQGGRWQKPLPSCWLKAAAS